VYEIKDTSGNILYVAKNANDIRAALQEAVMTGAYLTGANLTRANLIGANLAMANLTRANLIGANLAMANLTGANLTRANLIGANLAGANLAMANLAMANLARANLAMANLARAIWEEVAVKLEESLQSMNDNGRHWIKGTLQRTIEDGSTAYCSIGSVESNSEGTVRAVALWLLGSVCGGDIANFNDYEPTTWKDVQQVFAVATLHARRFADK
jgi:uncharacterized protein YjbI with pentapeptide repeats